MSVSPHQKMHGDCEGNGVCWTRNRNMCIKGFDQITCICFINSRDPSMNGYCKPVMCKYGCVLLKCASCAQLHPLRNMPDNYGRRCKQCVAQARVAEGDAAMKSPDQEIKELPVAAATARCRVCNATSDAPVDCEQAHFTKLSDLLPMHFDQYGARRIRIHNQNFDNYTPYGKILAIACYMQSEIPNESSRSVSIIYHVSKTRILVAEALQSSDEACISAIAGISDEIRTTIGLLFSDCDGVHMRCLRYVRDIMTAAAKPATNTMSSP